MINSAQTRNIVDPDIESKGVSLSCQKLCPVDLPIYHERTEADPDAGKVDADGTRELGANISKVAD